MSDFDFLKEFGQNLDQEKPMEPAEAGWERLSAELAVRERSQRRRRRLVLWILPGIILGLFALLGGMLWQTRSQADQMQTELLRLKRDLNTKSTVSVTDTVVQHFSIIQYDTTFRTVIIQTLSPAGTEPVFYPENNHLIQSGFSENKAKLLKNNNKQVEESSNNALKNTSPQQAFLTNTVNQSAALPKDNTPAPQNPENSLVTKQKILVDTVETLVSTNEFAQILIPDSIRSKDGLFLLPLKSVPLSKNQPPLTVPYLSGPLAGASAPAPLIRRWRPHDVAVGITAGKYFPRTLDSVVWHIRTLGIRAQIGFGRHLRLVGGVEHGSTNFRVNTSGLHRFHIPPITPPTSFDQLSHVGVEQSLWDFSLGLHYVFMPEKKLHLLIGAGWTGEKIQAENFRYEFRNFQTGEERHTSVPNLPAPFQNGLQLGTGVEWAFARRFSLGLEGLYTRQQTTLTPISANRWGFRAGLTVSF